MAALRLPFFCLWLHSESHISYARQEKKEYTVFKEIILNYANETGSENEERHHWW